MTSIPCLATASLVLALGMSTPASAGPGDAMTPSPAPTGSPTIQPKVVEMFRAMPRLECVVSGPEGLPQALATVRLRNSGNVPIAAGTTLAWTVHANPPRGGERVLGAALQPGDMLVTNARAHPQTETCSARIKPPGATPN